VFFTHNTFMYKALPKSLEAAFKRPWAYWPYLAMAWGLLALTSYYQDLDDEEMDALRGLLPEWLGHTQTVMLPFRDQHGRFMPIDLSYWFPFGGWLKAAGLLADGQVFKALDEIGLGGNPGFQVPASLMRNQDGLGREIWDPGDAPERQALDIAAFLTNQALPPTVPQVTGLIDALRGVPDRWGNPQRTPAQAGARILGITTQPMDVEVAYMRGSWARMSEIRDAEQRAREIARDQSLTEEERERRLERQIAIIEKRTEEFRQWQQRVAPALELAR
jgi:hypothetical protein